MQIVLADSAALRPFPVLVLDVLPHAIPQLSWFVTGYWMHANYSVCAACLLVRAAAATC
jgi:hypothetical protein